MKVLKPGLSYYTERVGKPFAFVRYGDGEFISILGATRGQNCDNHDYFPELGTQLRESLTLTDDNYIRAIGPMAFQENRNLKIQKYLKNRKLLYNWHSTEVFLDASLKGQLNPLVNALRSKKLLYAAPPHLTQFLKNELNATVMELPETNAFLKINTIHKDILRKIGNYDVFCISGGMPAKVILYRLWFKNSVKNKTLLDMGSIFDGYVGKNSRSHTKRLTESIMRQNLAQ